MVCMFLLFSSVFVLLFFFRQNVLFSMISIAKQQRDKTFYVIYHIWLACFTLELGKKEFQLDDAALLRHFFFCFRFLK